MWKSGNCIFARERTSKSSFLGSVFHANSSFFDTCFRNLWLPPLIEGIIHIILNLWTHLASHLRPKFVIFCTSFFVWFFHPRSISKVKSCWGICDTTGVRGELGLQEAMGLQEAANHKNRCPSELKCKSCIKMLILHNVFEGQITKYCKLHAKMMDGKFGGARLLPRPLYQDRENPYR